MKNTSSYASVKQGTA